MLQTARSTFGLSKRYDLQRILNYLHLIRIGC